MDAIKDMQNTWDRLHFDNEKLRQDLAIKRRDTRIVEKELNRLKDLQTENVIELRSELHKVIYLIKMLKAR